MSECGKSCIVIAQTALKPSPFPAVISAGVIEIERRHGIASKPRPLPPLGEQNDKF